jgi:glutamate/tyrosine decarboxylase-like PLP-dependent enzyme
MTEGVDPALLHRVADLAAAYLGGLDERPVRASASLDELRAAIGGPLPDEGAAPEAVVEQLAAGADPGLVASPGPRYFGFVIGGSLPAALAADWLTSAWDQNSALFVMSPAAAVVEETVADWVLDLLDLPRGSGVGLVGGATVASFTALLAARAEVLRRVGWDVEEDGLAGAPAIRILVGANVHASLLLGLRMAGFGRAQIETVAADDQGRMRMAALEASLAAGIDRPTIVCAQAGDVNSGAFDPLGEVADIAHAGGAWCHVDGAFGLWARAAPTLAHLAAGAERADSWGIDAHKWLNVPYDGAFAIVADADAHRRATAISAAYLPTSDADERSGYDWAPDSSRRARGFASWAALRSLGKSGVADLIERNCALARRAAEQLAAVPGVEVLNDVVLNQVLVRFGDDDAVTDNVVARVQADGTCWLGGSAWQGRRVMRISVSNWSTTEADIDRSVAAIVAATQAT